MSKPPEPRKALGKGLTALLPTRPPVKSAESQLSDAPGPATEIPIELIDANPHQARRVFRTDKLEELAQSIRSNGIIQPLVVRRKANRYQLVAGERRWRAAKLAGMTSLPAVIRDIADERLLEITLIENIQREDLNPIETAQAFDRLGKDLHLSHEQIGNRTGKDRTTITNLLRLLNLPADIQELVAERKLSTGHARCIVGLPGADLQREVAEKSVAKGWSVRELERVTQKMMENRQPKHVDEIQLDPNVKAAIQEMERVLGTRVKIVEKAKKGGRIEIEYYSSDDLDRIYSAIVGPT